jgi:hypothetical protein
MILLCVAKKGNFTSEASPLCLRRAHKSQRTVGHSPREGGRAKLNLSKSVDIAHSAEPENERRASVFYKELIFLDCVHGKALQVPCVPASSGGVAA